MHGWLAAKKMNIASLGEFQDMGECKQCNHLLNKFPDDQILIENDEYVSFLNGYIHNKADYNRGTSMDWPTAFSRALQQDVGECIKKLRGGFCGYFYDKRADIVILYTDQSVVKPVYYYMDGDKWMLSDRMDYMVEVLKANQISYDFNPLAAKYMLTYGYMIDDSTFIKQIHRLLPGMYVCIEKGQASLTRYHMIKDEGIDVSETEAVEIIDRAFREAIRREFEKDREYGYRHLVDLSGGLDSRMVSWVAHEMGYTDQVNVTYSRMGYRDEKISKQIAAYLGHEYVFKPLDDVKWMYDIEETTSLNNGSALYSGITGGARMLALLRTEQFGIEHTGMIGDLVVGSLYHDKAFSYGAPVFGKNAYSGMLQYQFDEALLKGYPCQEMFGIYTRGMLGAASSYIIRQNFVETSSPFMDVDFLDATFSVPFDYRNHHHIYMKWIHEKYPKAAEFGWEKWGGVRPKENLIFARKIKTTQRLFIQAACTAFHIQNKDNMNPLDYWYDKNRDLQKFYEEFYKNGINTQILDEELRKDISMMFQTGNVTDKGMALTVLAMIKKYF